MRPLSTPVVDGRPQSTSVVDAPVSDATVWSGTDDGPGWPGATTTDAGRRLPGVTFHTLDLPHASTSSTRGISLRSNGSEPLGSVVVQYTD
ncbi:hypothetical protein HSB1_29800 [Halogranum salarium B-1]|uniref:Uncharacterized protein n=1 Tax=Halogranum salarium B-1 TaxID=1210908 RepID=J3EV93_9EURY|nr:hypothetical protein HSB1_29800 [Halogranum salarium B-1]